MNSEEHKRQDVRTNGDCCFNHIIGLPQRNGVDKPFYDYKKIIFDSLIASPIDTKNGNINPINKHLWIKKTTGLGISEFMLRFMTWLCIKNNALSGLIYLLITQE